jgi:LuxR family maltose regulon positive regulatory protein
VGHQNGQVRTLERLSERDLSGSILAPDQLLEWKLRVPSARPGIVWRAALVDRLLASQAVPVVCVVAPPGYGKSTLLSQWADRMGRRVGWVSVDGRDNDLVVLLTYLAVALDRVEPIDPGVFQVLAAPGVSARATVLPRLMAAVSAMTQPVVLVLDHLELLENQECLDAVAELAACLPSGSQLALASRARPPLPLARLRAQGQVTEVGVAELAMDQQEARALLEGTGVQLDEAGVASLVRRTEGWPVGLYLAALALQAGAPQDGPGITGDDRLVADYLHSELLTRLSPDEVAFLTRTAVLERMSGPLCDAVLGTQGAAGILESMDGANLLLVPLDRRRQWYRYHHLFRDLLRVELERREPELVPQLHRRAATWYEANGLPEAAIDHAQAGGDSDRVAGLVVTLTQPAYAAGRVDTARRWLVWFEDQGLLERYPQVAVQGAWVQALVGQPAAAERWAAVAERDSATGTLPDGSTMQSYLALMGALLCRNGNGMAQMRADAQVAREQLSPGSPWRATALLLEGISYLLDGEVEHADPILGDAVEVATLAGATPAAATALAQRALVAIHRDDWLQAETLAQQALAVMRAGHVDNYAMSPFVYAVAARTALHQGDVLGAQRHLAHAARLRPLLTYAMPHRAAQTLLELARAHLTLSDTAAATVVLREAGDLLRQRPNLGVLPTQAEALRGQLEAIRGERLGVSLLSTAELRLLPLLFTHLSFREIGQRLYLSQHTVKSQAVSIYRKLGVSSRSQAIQRAQQLGVGPDASTGPPPFLPRG